MTTALLADDEPNMLESLRDLLGQFWPELHIIAEAPDGLSALAKIESLKPDIAFLDIRMPGLTGLQVARSITEPTHIVFVTAYDNHALEAFEANAVDYVVKPLDSERLAKMVSKLKRLTGTGAKPSKDVLISALHQFGIAQGDQGQEKSFQQPKRKEWLQVTVGTQVRLVNVQDVHYFVSDTKYTRVVTDECDGLIRISIKDLTEQFVNDDFIQTHRSTLVNRRFIRAVHRKDDQVEIEMRGQGERLKVSAVKHYLFRAM